LINHSCFFCFIYPARSIGLLRVWVALSAQNYTLFLESADLKRDIDRAGMTRCAFRDIDRVGMTRCAFRDIDRVGMTRCAFRDIDRAGMTRCAFRDIDRAGMTRSLLREINLPVNVPFPAEFVLLPPIYLL